MFQVSLYENLPSRGFRAGEFTVTMRNGYQFSKFASIPVCQEQVEILHARINRFIESDTLLHAMTKQIAHDAALADLLNAQAAEHEAREQAAAAIKNLTPSQFDVLQKFTIPF